MTDTASLFPASRRNGSMAKQAASSRARRRLGASARSAAWFPTDARHVERDRASAGQEPHGDLHGHARLWLVLAPPSESGALYAKREMGKDVVRVMERLGFIRFDIAAMTAARAWPTGSRSIIREP